MAEQEAPDAGAPSGARPVATGPRARRWWRRIPLRRQLLYAFVVPLAIAVLSSLFVANTLLDLREGVAATARTGETVRLRYVLLNAVADAEAGFRGYLLTGDDAFLRAYLTSPRVFETTMGRLEGMQAGDAADLRRLREAQAQFDNWRRVFAQPLLALREGAPPRVVEELRGFDAALAAGTVPPEAAATLQVMAARFPPGSARGARLARAATLLATSPRAAAIEVDAVATEVATDSAAITAAIASGRGKALLDEVRWIVNAALDEQLAELADRHAEDQVRAQDARWMALFAPIVAVLVGLGVTWLMLFDARRGIEAVAKAAERVASGDLDRRARVLRDDEIGQLAAAFNRMASDLSDRRRRSDAIQRHQALLAGSDSATELYDVAESVCRGLFPHASGAIYRIRSSRTLAERVAAWRWPDDGPVQLEPGDCRALRSGRPLFYDGVAQGVACAHTQAIGATVRRSLCLPLVAQGEMLGIVQFAQFGDGPRGPISERDHASAQLVAEQLGMAIANLELRETLRYQSIRDSLTGLHNRRYLEETLARELERSLRNGRPLSLAVLDVDHFKRFNDAHGHAAGDRALQSVAEVLRRGVRGSDVACRFGGEEFVLLMPDMPCDIAVARVDALRQELEQRPAATRDLGQALTFSAGVACAPKDGSDPDALLRNADTALYAAKTAGRNRVCAADA